MPESTKTELLDIRPLSRFIECFDFSPPPELLDVVIEDNNKAPPLPSKSISTKPSKLTIKDPLLTLYDSNDQMISPTSPKAHNTPSQTFPTKTKSSQPLSNPNRVSRFPPSTTTSSRLSFSPQEQDFYSSTKISRKQLNRADLIIRRYDSWLKFISVIISWMNDIVKTTTQSERMMNTLLKEPRFSSVKGNTIESANEIHALLYGFTTDLASQEQKLIQDLKNQIPIMEKLKRECTTHLKALKSRSDLSQEEFLKRAELTATYMSQLTKACKEARSAIQKKAPLTTDPWLINLYVLRQLKKEVDEDNRLRKLMVPIQQKIKDFERKLLEAVKEALEVVFCLPNSFMTKGKMQETLQKAIECSWESFVEANRKILVDEENPEKKYLQINYGCKYDPFVMTLHKGQLERRMGVLNKYSCKFFVLTESGFLHQFKLNDKVSPESTIYIPNATIVTNVDITNINQQKMETTKQQKKRDYYTFEIQRNGSVLQRDKSYLFRLSSLEEMVVWCKLLQNVETRPYDTLLHEKIVDVDHSTRNSVDAKNYYLESTPPPSPTKHRESKKVLLEDEKHESESSSDGGIVDSLIINGRHDVYAPRLNIT